MKIDRLLNIMMILVNKDKVTAKELAEYFHVSVRTIQRDMDTLSMAGIPIYADVGKKGGYQLLEHYKIDKNFLNTNEAKVLITFLKSLKQSVPYFEIKSVFNKFSTVLDSQFEESKLVIRLNPGMNHKVFEKKLNELSNAIDEQYKIKLNYIDMNYQATERIVCPYTLAMLGATWYLYGYCELRKGFRLFKLNRITSISRLEEHFEIKETPKPLPWDENLDSGRDSTKITLEIDKILLGKLPDYFDYRKCEVLEDKIIVNLDFPVDEWLYSMLFNLVPYVKIMEPFWLREEFVKRLKLSLEINKI